MSYNIVPVLIKGQYNNSKIALTWIHTTIIIMRLHHTYDTAHFQLDTCSRALTKLLDKYFNLLANYLQVLERALM